MSYRPNEGEDALVDLGKSILVGQILCGWVGSRSIADQSWQLIAVCGIIGKVGNHI